LLVSDGTNTYLHANGLQSATDASNTTSYALGDALGSIRGLTDANGSLTGTADHDAFGAVRSQSGFSLPLGFTGALTDPTTRFIGSGVALFPSNTGRLCQVHGVRIRQPHAAMTSSTGKRSFQALKPPSRATALNPRA
jgi:hypothetical protein